MIRKPAPGPLGRRVLALTAIVALLAATVMVTANDAQLPGAFTMPGATAEPPAPTGPGGPTGPGFGGGGGSQFQPPGWPQAGPGYSGGNYPAPPQGNGIDINNPSAAPDYNPTPQNPQQQPNASRQPPVHGTQPPDYDAPRQQPPTQQAPAQQGSQQSAQPSAPQHQPEREVEPTPPSEPAQQTPQQQVEHEDAQYSRENGKDNTPEQCNKAESETAAGQPISDLGLFRNGDGSIDGGVVRYLWGTGSWGRHAEVLDAITRWNAVSKVKILENSGPHVPDVRIVAENFGPTKWVGRLSPRLIGPDELAFNEFFAIPSEANPYVNGLSPSEITGVFVHELGHALGLAHSCPGQAMHAISDASQAAFPQAIDIAAANQGR